MNIHSIQRGMLPMGSQSRPQPMTEEQQAQVASILSDYDASALTEDDALSIVEAIEDAGLRPGRELGNAITDAGFDPGEIASLAGLSKQGPPPPPPPPAGTSSEINIEAVAELQEILSQYDLDNLTSEEEADLLEKLQSSGLLTPGSLINETI